MLQLTIPISPEYWDDEKEVFVPPETITVEMEHSLLSISKWEERWHKAFLTKKEKTTEETIDYLRCMTITPNVDPDVWKNINKDHVDKVYEYINDPMTATTIREMPNTKKSSEVVTAELIYHWMIAANIPLDKESWHLNKLLTLIRVCAVKSSPPKKMSNQAILKQNAALNKARRQQHNSRG